MFANTASSTTAPAAAVTSANECVAAWVSTPMTNVYSAATMDIATEFLPIGDVVSASARKKHFEAGLSASTGPATTNAFRRFNRIHHTRPRHDCVCLRAGEGAIARAADRGL